MNPAATFCTSGASKLELILAGTVLPAGLLIVDLLVGEAELQPWANGNLTVAAPVVMINYRGKRHTRLVCFISIVRQV